MERAEGLGQHGAERLEAVRRACVKPGLHGCWLVNERGERRDRLVDLGPLERALVAVVVRWADALGLALDPGHVLDRAAVALGDARRDYARERAMVALDPHDPCRGDPKVGGAEVPHPDQVRGDERVLECDHTFSVVWASENIVDG